VIRFNKFSIQKREPFLNEISIAKQKQTKTLSKTHLIRRQASGHFLGGGGAHQISATGLVVHTVGVTQWLDVLQVRIARVLQWRGIGNA